MEEDEAVLRIRQNPRAFFSFCRSRAKVKAKIGPFLDPTTGKSNSSPEFAAECLRKQYDGVFSIPRKEWSVDDPEQFFTENSPDEPKKFDDLEFTPTDIEKACSELRANAAPGPDGVPAMLLKASLCTLEEVLGQWHHPPRTPPCSSNPCTQGREPSSTQKL